MTHDVLGPTQTRLSIVVESALRKKGEQGMRKEKVITSEQSTPLYFHYYSDAADITDFTTD
jgi:hypothetical protein